MTVAFGIFDETTDAYFLDVVMWLEEELLVGATGRSTSPKQQILIGLRPLSRASRLRARLFLHASLLELQLRTTTRFDGMRWIGRKPMTLNVLVAKIACRTVDAIFDIKASVC